MYDNICTTDDITLSLSHQTMEFMISHPLQAWHHTHCIRHHTHCILFITISPLISHPRLYDITPTICVTSYSLYTTSHHSLCHHTTYLWHHSLYTRNHIQYVGQHIHYTRDIIATNLCHHTHTIDIIIPTLCMTSHSAYEWQILHYTRHHILTLWHQTTIFMTSYPLYLRSYPLYLCNHIQCIDDISPTATMRSHPLYMTSYPLYMTSQSMYVCNHTHIFNDITPFVCRTSHPQYV